MSVSLTVRVTAIRSQNPRGFGGAIFTGKPVGGDGSIMDATRYIVVKAPARALVGRRVEQGQWWQVAGNSSSRMLEVNGYRVEEQQVVASALSLSRPSGEHIVQMLAENPAFECIGAVKARQCWDRFGEQLYEILDSGNVEVLSQVLAPKVAQKAIAAWAVYGDAKTLRWLQAQGFDVELGRKVTGFFGPETAAKIEEDPYRLLSFSGAWSDVDALALSRFDVGVADPRRLRGAIEESCYRLFNAGHTATDRGALENQAAALLKTQPSTPKWRHLVSACLEAGETNGSFIANERCIQPLGAAVMESLIAESIAARVAQGTRAQLLSADRVETIIENYERLSGLALTTEQGRAIHLACSCAFACITGGAGVGKTTVLKALYEMYELAGLRIVQLALAGRAAKRMQEASGRTATTIATFLRGFKEGDLNCPAVVVIDEASMVDVIGMSQICEVLPPHVRLLLVGDASQLMPIGPGLIFHAVVPLPEVPVAELTIVKRHGDAIREGARSIREGIWPGLSESPTSDIAFIRCDSSADAISHSIAALSEDPRNTQIVCASRVGPAGTRRINQLCQDRFGDHANPLHVWNSVEDRYEYAGIYLNDVLLCTRNLWDRGLQNGSLGRVVQIDSEPKRIFDSDGNEQGYAIAWVEWDDGVRRPVFEYMLDDLELGYAITVHKAQGSQWPRVIVAVAGSRLLDRTLLYTAVTRAQRQVLLVGDEAAARRATIDLPRAASRHIDLDAKLTKLLQRAPAMV